MSEQTTSRQQREAATQTTQPAQIAPEFDRLLNMPAKMEYVPYGSKDSIKLTIEIVQKLVAERTRSGKVCSDRDAAKFMLMCQAKRLNPFEGDAFLVGYDSQDGPKFSLITAHQAFLKRAELHPEYDGMKSGVIVKNEDGSLTELEGDFHTEDQEVVGGWATVFFKNRKVPATRRIRRARFDTGRSQWEKDPAGMICKCAEADALRSSFPTMMGGLYLREEAEMPGFGDALARIAKPIEIATPNIPALPAPADDGDLGPQRKPGRPRKTTSDAGTVPPTSANPPHQAEPEPAVSAAPASESISAVRSIKDDTITALIENGVSFDQFQGYLLTYGIFRDADSFGNHEEMPSHVYEAVQGNTLVKIIKLYGAK